MSKNKSFTTISRECFKCGEKFDSTQSDHRHCNKCRKEMWGKKLGNKGKSIHQAAHGRIIYPLLSEKTKEIG